MQGGAVDGDFPGLESGGKGRDDGEGRRHKQQATNVAAGERDMGYLRRNGYSTQPRLRQRPALGKIRQGDHIGLAGEGFFHQHAMHFASASAQQSLSTNKLIVAVGCVAQGGQDAAAGGDAASTRVSMPPRLEPGRRSVVESAPTRVLVKTSSSDAGASCGMDVASGLPSVRNGCRQGRERSCCAGNRRIVSVVESDAHIITAMPAARAAMPGLLRPLQQRRTLVTDHADDPVLEIHQQQERFWRGRR